MMWHMTDCPICGRAMDKPWLSERYPDSPGKLVIAACSQYCLDQVVTHVNRVIQNMLEMSARPIEPQYFCIKPAPKATKMDEPEHRTFESLLRAQDPNFRYSYAGNVLYDAIENAKPDEWTRKCYTIRYKSQKFSLDELRRFGDDDKVFYLVHISKNYYVLLKT